MSSETCVMELGCRPHRPAPFCLRDLSAGSRWAAVVNTNTRKLGAACTFRRSSPLVFVCQGLGSDGPTLWSEVIADCNEGLQ